MRIQRWVCWRGLSFVLLPLLFVGQFSPQSLNWTYLCVRTFLFELDLCGSLCWFESLWVQTPFSVQTSLKSRPCVAWALSYVQTSLGRDLLVFQ